MHLNLFTKKKNAFKFIKLTTCNDTHPKKKKKVHAMIIQPKEYM